MALIQIFENRCCAPSDTADGCCAPVSEAEQLARFLRARPGSSHEITVINVGDGVPAADVPADVRDRLRVPDGTPAIVVDGRLAHAGPLPNWLQVLGLIDRAAHARTDSGHVAAEG